MFRVKRWLSRAPGSARGITLKVTGRLRTARSADCSRPVDCIVGRLTDANGTLCPTGAYHSSKSAFTHSNLAVKIFAFPPQFEFGVPDACWSLTKHSPTITLQVILSDFDIAAMSNFLRWLYYCVELMPSAAAAIANELIRANTNPVNFSFFVPSTGALCQ
jgi:hypothetical protein